jgi:inosine/xanthosine triphosphate pyrophosphatase family protein
MAQRLLIATRNSAKAARFRTLLAGLPFELYTPDDLPAVADAPSEKSEVGATHLAIASDKAAAWSRHTGGIAIASDGGVDIPVLGSVWRSVTTKRSTGEEVPDEERAARLLELLRGHPESERQVWWIEAVAVARNGAVIRAWEVRGLPGLLTDAYTTAPALYRGFWVYAMWFFPQFGRRYWDLSDEELRQADEPWFTIGPGVVDLMRQLEIAATIVPAQMEETR